MENAVSRDFEVGKLRHLVISVGGVVKPPEWQVGLRDRLPPRDSVLVDGRDENLDGGDVRGSEEDGLVMSTRVEEADGKGRYVGELVAFPGDVVGDLWCRKEWGRCHGGIREDCRKYSEWSDEGKT